MRLSVGLLGRLLLILLLTVVIEFGVSTLLYERASSFSWREDEARRLAEHLVIARKLLTERPPPERPAIAEELSTDRYDISWTPATSAPAPTILSPDLIDMQGDILAWEPSLAESGLRLSTPRFERLSTVVGALQLSDRSWVYFAAHGGSHRWDLAIGRILMALIPAIALLIVGSLLIRRTLQPLQHLAAATEQIGASAPVLLPEEGTREMRLLIRAFNDMQGRIHRLVADRIQALAAVGHDIRTPLARVQLRIDAIKDAEIRDGIESDVAEIEAMVASLLAFIGGEDDPERPVAVDLAVLTGTIVGRVADEGRDARYEGPDRCQAVLRPIEMRRAITNLVDNALHYGGTALVTLRVEPDRIVLTVEDDGPGIPDEDLASVLEPFVRLDTARGRNTRGLGLGLSIVARAVAREGGTLRLSNRAQGGLCAEIGLPRCAKPVGSATISYTHAASQQGEVST